MTHKKGDYYRRPQYVAETIKQMIVEQGLRPGDRLPSEQALIEHFAMSKGTVREAIRLLDAQGLVKTRTGPNGGIFVHAPSESRTQSLLSNYFYFKDLSVRDIYQLRLALEPELAYELAGELTAAQQLALHESHLACASDATNVEQERQQHISSLKFHRLLASYSKNPMLSFTVSFLVNVLMDVTTHRRLFEPQNPDLRAQGYQYQNQLLEALKRGDKPAAQQISKSHMLMAQQRMEQQEAAVAERFFNDQLPS